MKKAIFVLAVILISTNGSNAAITGEYSGDEISNESSCSEPIKDNTSLEGYDLVPVDSGVTDVIEFDASIDGTATEFTFGVKSLQERFSIARRAFDHSCGFSVTGQQEIFWGLDGTKEDWDSGGFWGGSKPGSDFYIHIGTDPSTIVKLDLGDFVLVSGK